jgi:hypothetical protein
MGLHLVGLGNAGNSCCYRDALFSRNNGIRLCRSANTGHYSALRLCAGYALHHSRFDEHSPLPISLNAILPNTIPLSLPPGFQFQPGVDQYGYAYQATINGLMLTLCGSTKPGPCGYGNPNYTSGTIYLNRSTTTPQYTYTNAPLPVSNRTSSLPVLTRQAMNGCS